jgi:hypothetical protein
MQPCELRLGSDENGNVGVCLFPQGEKIPIGAPCRGKVSGQSGGSRAEMLDLNTLIAGDAGIELQFAAWINEKGVIAAGGVLTTGSNMGEARAVLLIPNGPCDPGVQAARAAALQNMAAARQSATAGGLKGALFRGPDGRVNPVFLKPVSPAVLRSQIQNQSE